jgi:hypothetical protein
VFAVIFPLSSSGRLDYEDQESRRNGIQWTLLDELDNLDFADDLALLSHSCKQMQNKTTTVYIGNNIGQGRAQGKQQENRANEDQHHFQYPHISG